jgi:hypothetical protein
MNLFKPFHQSPDAADFDRDEEKFYGSEKGKYAEAKKADVVPRRARPTVRVRTQPPFCGKSRDLRKTESAPVK